MMRLKVSMLMNILQNVDSSNKYSKSFLNLKNVIELEKNDIHKDFIDEFLIIEEEYNNFINEIPLVVVEKYVMLSRLNINDICYILYNGKEITEYSIIELHNKLEEFFAKIFFLASKIADYYNIEVKLNKNIMNEDISKI
jgi:hypothetical protein